MAKIKNILGTISLFIVGSLITLLVMHCLSMDNAESWAALLAMNVCQGGFSFVRALKTD